MSQKFLSSNLIRPAMMAGLIAQLLAHSPTGRMIVLWVLMAARLLKDRRVISWGYVSKAWLGAGDQRSETRKGLADNEHKNARIGELMIKGHRS